MATAKPSTQRQHMNVPMQSPEDEAFYWTDEGIEFLQDWREFGSGEEGDFGNPAAREKVSEVALNQIRADGDTPHILARTGVLAQAEIRSKAEIISRVKALKAQQEEKPDEWTEENEMELKENQRDLAFENQLQLALGEAATGIKESPSQAAQRRSEFRRLFKEFKKNRPETPINQSRIDEMISEIDGEEEKPDEAEITSRLKALKAQKEEKPAEWTAENESELKENQLELAFLKANLSNPYTHSALDEKTFQTALQQPEVPGDFAIVEACGRQYWLQPNMFYDFDRMPLEVGDTFELNKVLASKRHGFYKLGKPYCDTKVTAKVIGHSKDKKIRIFKMKPKKHYRKSQGHRSQKTRIFVTGIESNEELAGIY
jgi:large subunit ribosomal protein L21